MPKPYARLRVRMSPDAQARAEDKARALLDAEAHAVARLAYEAYVNTVTDKPRLGWEFLSGRTHRAWEAAVQTVRRHDQEHA